MWFGAGASVAGMGRTENQDAWALDRTPDRLIAVVSDGAGTAPQGALGAQTVVRLTHAYLKQNFPPNPQILLNILQKKLRAYPGGIMDRAATLVAVVATPQETYCIQVGDGFAVVRFEDAYDLLIAPQKGEYANQTVFVTQGDAGDHIKLYHVEKKVKFLCMATDGLETVALFQHNWKPHGGFFNPLDRYIQKTDCQKDATQTLTQFLDSSDLQRKSWDDKTIILGCWRD